VAVLSKATNLPSALTLVGKAIGPVPALAGPVPAA